MFRVDPCKGPILEEDTKRYGSWDVGFGGVRVQRIPEIGTVGIQGVWPWLQELYANLRRCRGLGLIQNIFLGIRCGF